MNAKTMAALVCAACFVNTLAAIEASTIHVSAGKTRAIARNTVFTGGALVKTGPGTLDLSGVLLKNAGLVIKEGSVRFALGDGTVPASARYVRFTASASRPNAAYSRSGWQLAEFMLTREGKPLANPPGTKGMTSSGHPGGHEGPVCGVDGELKTKCYIGYGSYMVVDYGAPVVFDGYTFVTGNDAPGRDPMDFTLDIGEAYGMEIFWTRVSSVKGFMCPTKRHTPIGRAFPVQARDLIPRGYPVTIDAAGKLELSGLNETLENLSGGGLVSLSGSTLDLSESSFTGSVYGSGNVVWGNK